MAYDPKFLGGPVYFASEGAGAIWMLDTVDADPTVSNYISDGALRKMSKGDLVIVRRFDDLQTKATLTSVTLYYVSAVGAAGATLTALS